MRVTIEDQLHDQIVRMLEKGTQSEEIETFLSERGIDKEKASKFLRDANEEVNKIKSRKSKITMFWCSIGLGLVLLRLVLGHNSTLSIILSLSAIVLIIGFVIVRNRKN